MSTVFKARTTKPEAGNKYYIRKENGGYSRAIKGKPMDKDCNVLSNCVGYAYGRFNEIGGWGSCKYLSPVNAEQFIKYKGSLEVGYTPKLGACMVWQKGKTLDGSDGAGHVAIVEKIISDTEVMTSESAYGGSAFYTKTRKKGSDGNWGYGSGYKFLGFIYNPAPCCQTTVKPAPKPVSKPTTSKDKVYTVVKGDSLYKIGKKFGVAWIKIANANGIKEPYTIYVGDKLTIPGVVETTSTSTSTTTKPATSTDKAYTVVKGDSLYKIGKKFGVSWQKIASANGIKEPYTIYVGDKLTIPNK